MDFLLIKKVKSGDEQAGEQLIKKYLRVKTSHGCL